MVPMSNSRAVTYREKLWPSPMLLIALLLLIPAGLLAVYPVNASIAPYIAVALYMVIAGSLVLAAPTIAVRDAVLHAGNARIPVSQIGATELLDADGLRRILGPGADARAYLVVRGYIHRGVRVEIADQSDPTPYWVLTSRRPQQLIQALSGARAA